MLYGFCINFRWGRLYKVIVWCNNFIVVDVKWVVRKLWFSVKIVVAVKKFVLSFRLMYYPFLRVITPKIKKHTPFF
jgi:hypothetical protein